MRTSLQWWQSIRHDREALGTWLQKQYHGEVTSVERLRSFLAEYGHQATDKQCGVVWEIIRQEGLHAEWVEQCLLNRGLRPAVLSKTGRYWDKTLRNINSFTRGCAVAAHAETMRVERLRVIANDQTAPHDIKTTFEKILVQELWHSHQFTLMGYSEMDATAAAHAEGLEALGLVI